MSIKLEKFKRANFFTGLMATPKFWNDIQDYHFDKERFYNLVFCGYGIVPGISDELKVGSLKKKGDNLSIVVGPGFAIDKKGRGVYLYEPSIKVIDYKNFKLPVTIYITIKYDEQLDDFYQNDENSEYQGYQKKLETAIVEITSKVPDDNCLELARIYLEEDGKGGGIKQITDAVDPANPAANEIDMRFAAWARVARRGLSPYLKQYFVEVLEETHNGALSAYGALNLPALRELQTISLTAKMLVQCGELAFEDSINVVNPIFNVNNHITQEIIDYEKKQEKQVFSKKEAFNDLRNRIYEMGDLIKYYDSQYETLDKILKCQKGIMDCLKRVFMTSKLTLEDIALISHDLQMVLVIGDEQFTLVDFLDFNDSRTEANHEFNKEEANNFQTLNQAFLYPDKVKVADITKVYVGGKVSFKISNLIKFRKLLLIRRTDIFHGNYKVDVAVNGEVKKQIIIDSSDTKNRWRNVSLVFEDQLITDNTLEISFIMPENVRDNFGKIWIYQHV